MIQAIQPSTAESPEAAFYPSLKNPAVALCTEVWQKIHAEPLEQTRNLYTAERCAGYAMLLGAIKNESGTKLLYAAQVALATLPKESKTQTRTEPRPSPHPTPPPLLPQPRKKKRIRSKTPASPRRNKELATFAAGENPGQP